MICKVFVEKCARLGSVTAGAVGAVVTPAVTRHQDTFAEDQVDHELYEV